MNVKKRLRRGPAAEYLKSNYGIGTKLSLAQYAARGTGPDMEYFGSIPLYSIESLDRWALSKLSEPVCKTRSRKAAVKAEAAE
jgi:hypothetical protein